MATSLSNETSTTSLIELSQTPLLSGSQNSDSSYPSLSKSPNAAARSDNCGYGSSCQGANVTTSSNQNSTPSMKNRGDSLSTSQSYQQQQSSLIQSAGLAYPLFYPNTYLTGFPPTTSSAQYNYQSSAAANGNMQANQSAASTNNRRGGKKKAPITQSQNPELRQFFNLRRRDSQAQSCKGQSHVYKPKNPPPLPEWFKKLNVEERINALSTVCPHLTDTFLSMYQRIEQSGQSSFARIGPASSQEQKYFSPQSYLPPYQGFNPLMYHSSGDSSSSSFEENFYQRSICDTEQQQIMQSEKEKFEAEQEILKNVRLTDYASCLDTLTVSEEFVQDAESFFKLMSNATGNQAFSSSCQFETKSQSVTSIEQPSWFKPKSFHSFATWIIVALEENLWAHYNYDNNTNLGSAKVNELSTLFREKTDTGAQDVDLLQLSQYWRDTNDKDKKTLIDQFKSLISKDMEMDYASGNSGHSKSHKVVHSKGMQYSVHIKEKSDRSSFQEQMDYDLKELVLAAMKAGEEQGLITRLTYTTFQTQSQKLVSINRKFLDLIKKKYKDDLMENLLQEEDQVKSSKHFKKKQKKKNFIPTANVQQSSQGVQSISIAVDKGVQSSTENMGVSSDTQQDELLKFKGGNKKKRGKLQNQTPSIEKTSQCEQPQSTTLNNQRKKKKNNQNTNYSRNIKESPQTLQAQQDAHSCDEQQKALIEDAIEKEDTVESDNKNSSLDTKSSSNLFELHSTTHQSNNSTANSSVTLKSIHHDITPNNKIKDNTHANVDTTQILQLNASKSVDLNNSYKQKSMNDSPYTKTSKALSKVDTKNYQIFQNSQDTLITTSTTINNTANQTSTAKMINKSEDKQLKSNVNVQYSDGLIFSEDDMTRQHIINCDREMTTIQEMEHESESVEVIKQYVFELTNSMINEVCRRIENESPSRTTEEFAKCQQKNSNRNNKLCSAPQTQKQMSQKLPIDNNGDLLEFQSPLPSKFSSFNQRSYEKKQSQQRKNSLSASLALPGQNEAVEEKIIKKKSFNKKIVKEEKRFSEDYADSTQQFLVPQSSENIIDDNQDQKKIHSNEEGQLQSDDNKQSSQNETSQKSNTATRKGFGIHLKSNDKQEEVAICSRQRNDYQESSWAKGTAKQPDLNTGNKKKGQTQKQKQGGDYPVGEQEGNQAWSNNNDSKKASLNESTAGNSGKEDSIHNQNNKKKRNKNKKAKLTEADAMNQFMKSLHQHQDESKDYHDKYRDSGSTQSSYKKKYFEGGNSKHSSQPQFHQQRSQQHQKISQQQLQSEESLQQSLKVALDTSSNYGGEDYKATSSQSKLTYKQKSIPKTCQSNQNIVESQSTISQNTPIEEQPKQATVPEQVPQVTTPIYQVKKSSGLTNKQSTKSSIKANKVLPKTLETPTDDKESANSNKAECLSDDKSALSLNDKPLNSEPSSSNPRNDAFRQLNFQAATPNEAENNTSFTDLTASSNTAADTSIENNGPNLYASKYQSYQNTPCKQTTILTKNYHKMHANHSIQVPEQDPANYRTPPQMSKKQSTQSSYSHHETRGNGVCGGGGNYRKQQQHHNGGKSHNLNQPFNSQQVNNDCGMFQSQSSAYNTTGQGHSTSLKNLPKGQAQYRPANRTNSSNVFIQPMNISQTMQEQQQFIQTFMSPENSNIFYQDQNIMMNVNQNVDTFKQPQEGIFQYVEKSSPLILQQPIPCYSPNQYQMNQFVPSPQGPEILPNPFSYQQQRMNSVPYFDQSQDLIFQIFNSIKSNHSHSMSPIPQLISPPTLLDFQLLQSSVDLGFQPQRTDQNDYGMQDALFYQTLDNEITDYLKGIQENINLMKPERDYVYEKIAAFAAQVFVGQTPKLELFGSLITGLALESSDMDLAVTGLEIDDRFAMVTELNKLSQALQDWKCLESFKSIETASIPVIKMKVDLVKLREIEMIEVNQGDFAKRSIPETQRYLSVDITFDDSPLSNQCQPTSNILSPASQLKTHLGLQSCHLVQQYIENYKSLKQVAILLKKFLALHELNHPYYGIDYKREQHFFIGGISSYSTVVLIVAYMNFYSMKGNQDITPSRLLMGFLEFYGNYFNPGSMGISVYQDGSFYQLNGPLDSNFVILDPLNLLNNTTRNSYYTKEILLKFQCAFNNLKSLMLQLPQLPQALHTMTTTTFLKANSQDQKSSIPFEKASPQPTNFQPSACNMQQTSNNQYQQNIKIEQETDCGDQISPYRIEQEESEASNLALGVITEQQIEQPQMYQVSLLETFFAKDTQPVVDLSGVSSSQLEPRGTLITMIEEAHV